LSHIELARLQLCGEVFLEGIMFTLDQVVPWGRSFDEYRRMFVLTEADLQRKILGCADGPASFNAELTRRTGAITSVDPFYQLDATTIRDRIAATYDQVLQQTERNRHQFVWDSVSSPEELGRIRMQAMQAFLEDYDFGRRQGRLTVNFHLSTSRRNHLIWRFAHISSSYIRSICRRHSINLRFANCVGLLARSGSFPCSL
jgi:hypothetical protein